MLQHTYYANSTHPTSAQESKFHHGAAIRDFSWRQLFRHVRLIALSIAICLAIGLAYVGWRTPTYTAATQLLIDHKVVQFPRPDAIHGASAVDDALLQNQVAILRSEVIALQVIDNLGLADESGLLLYAAPEDRILGYLSSTAQTAVTWIKETTRDHLPLWVSGWFAQDASVDGRSNSDGMNAVLRVFYSNLSIEAPGRDRSITIRFTAPDPELAAKIANEVARVYLADQIEMNSRAARAASAWLREKVAELGTSARVLMTARPSQTPTGLGTGIVIAASLVAGLHFGFAAAFFRELTGRRVYTPEEATAATGAPYLGGLPRVRGRSIHRRKKTAVRVSDRRAVQQQARAFSWALEYPLSRFAHGINRLRLAVTDDASPSGGLHRAIGVTSIAPDEGKTVVAANLAHVLAERGFRVLLIDAVPYNRALSCGFTFNKGDGLLEVLGNRTELAHAVGVDANTGVHFLRLPTVLSQQAMTSQIWCQAIEQLVRSEQYDYSVVDLPPIGLVPDAVAAARFLDGFVLIVERGRIPVDLVVRTLASAGNVQDKLIGVVLNKIRTSRWQALIDGQFWPSRKHAPYVNDRYT